MRNDSEPEYRTVSSRARREGVAGDTIGAELLGRHRERDVLDRLLREVEAGQSRVLVLHGEAGAGKSALLDYVDQHASACRVIRAAGVEQESELAYSALQLLCSR